MGAGLPVALGAAMSAKLRGASAVALRFFGDGTTNIGTFHEALTMASVWKAPVVFICKNNLYGEYSPLRMTTPLDDLATRAVAYPMPGIIVDGNEVDDVYAQTTTAVARARAGEGPTLLECRLTATAATRAPTRASIASRASSKPGKPKTRSSVWGRHWHPRVS
jgi:TPP-dependent pyruvate/acetoin dehydrogenase alpha subunit